MKDSTFGVIMVIGVTLIFFAMFNVAMFNLPYAQERNNERNAFCRDNDYERTVREDYQYEVEFSNKHYIRCEKTIMKDNQITIVEDWVLNNTLVISEAKESK